MHFGEYTTPHASCMGQLAVDIDEEEVRRSAASTAHPKPSHLPHGLKRQKTRGRHPFSGNNANERARVHAYLE